MSTSLKGVFLIVAAGLLAVQAPDHLFAPPASDKKWAVVVGISSYEDKNLTLQYADKDAEAFAKFIGSKQGLAFPSNHVFSLTNSHATTASIVTAIWNKLAKNVQPGSSVYIFMAMHGIVESYGPHEAYLIASDTDPENLNPVTAIPFSELRKMIQERLARDGHVMLITDACHSGKMSEHAGFGKEVRKVSDVFGLLAAGGEESSLEHQKYGGGHGAFTYYLLRGLQGEADANHNGVVEYSELLDYLQKTVPPDTSPSQHPEPFGQPSVDFALSLVQEERADLEFRAPRTQELATLSVSCRGVCPPGSEVFVNDKPSGVVPAEGKLTVGGLPPDTYKVMTVARDGSRVVREIEVPADSTEVQFDGNALWPVPPKTRGLPEADDANAAQQILLAYLRGNAMRLTAADFDRCADLFQRAQASSPWPEQPQARSAFCAGRAALERGDFNRAATLLAESIRLEPNAGYAYNARGLLEMQRRAYRPAIAQFEAASQRSPRWVYPHFNTALAWAALNQTANAEREYLRAIELGPRYAYLHYNLAGLYMRINQPDRAEQQYRRALELDLDAAVGHNALGLFYRSRTNRNREAETEFRLALQFQDRDVPARLNLARLYESQGDARRSEQELIEGAAHAESPLIHTALGDLYTRQRRTPEAAAQYRRAAELERRQP